MDITVTHQADEATVAVSGPLNANTATALEAALDGAFDGAASVAFDFSDLDYISSAGLRVLMVAYKRATAGGGTIRVANACEEVREVFEITGFSDLFEIA